MKIQSFEKGINNETKHEIIFFDETKLFLKGVSLQNILNALPKEYKDNFKNVNIRIIESCTVPGYSREGLAVFFGEFPEELWNYNFDTIYVK